MTKPSADQQTDNPTRGARVFAMYVKFSKDRWPEIEKAETDPDLHRKLSEEYIELNWSNPKARIDADLAEAAKGIF